MLAASLEQTESYPQDSNRYTIGADMVSPFNVYLTISTMNVDIEQFRIDLPRIVTKLERLIIGAKNEVLMRGS